MKNLFCILLIFVVCYSYKNVFSQECNDFCCFVDTTTFNYQSNLRSDGGCQSAYGLRFTSRGHLHMLVIFVGFNDTDSSDDYPTWVHDDIPEWAKGDNNKIFNKESDSIGVVDNLSDWYFEMSSGEFILTGEVFPEQVMIDYDVSGTVRMNSLVSELNSNIEYNNFDWSKFDNRVNNPNFNFDNSLYSDVNQTPAGPDGKLDYIAVIYRNELSSAWYGGNAGISGTGIPFTNHYVYFNNDSFQIVHGYTANRSGDSYRHFQQFFIHEVSHSTHNMPHVFGPNSMTVGNKFYCQHGWG